MRPLHRRLGRVAALAALLYLTLCASLFFTQRSYIYYPQPRALGDAQVVTMETPGARLRVTCREAPGSEALLYFGGNAEDVSRTLPTLAAAFPHHALYLPHYRGYGGSSGEPTEAALHEDALALFDRVRANHASVTVIGRSLGTGVAVPLAARRPVTRLVLVTPYDSVEALARRQFPYLPVSLLLQDRFESWRHAPQVRAPATLLLAEHDEVIPTENSLNLLRSFQEGVAHHRILAGTRHGDIESSAAYLPALRGD